MLVLKVLGGLVAVAVGVWLGLPGRYERNLEEIERTMQRNTELGVTHHRKAKRHFTPLAWLQRSLKARGERTRTRRAFKLEAPEDR